jgi:hypothetical protein
MRKIVLSLLIGSVLSFTGCSGKHVYPPLNLQTQCVIESDNIYYEVGEYSQYIRRIISKPSAFYYYELSNGLLDCNIGQLIVYSKNAGNEITKLEDKYKSILTDKEYKEFIKTAILTKKDSKEFKELRTKAAQAVRKGDIQCISPMSQQATLSYLKEKATQEAINNNPNVVAARLQYRAAQAASHKTVTVNKNVNHSGYVNSYNTNTNYNYGY